MSHLVAVRRDIYLVVRGEDCCAEALWRIETDSGTATLVRDRAGEFAARPEWLTPARDQLFFIDHDGGTRPSLWALRSGRE